jgi:outer membrane protein assembly factor BamB
MDTHGSPLAVVLLLSTLFLVSPTADASWTHPRADPANMGALGATHPGNGSTAWTKAFEHRIIGSPVSVNGNVLLAEAEVHAFDTETGEEEWSFRPTWSNFTLPPGWIESTPVTDGEAVVFSTAYPSIHAIDLETGVERWRVQTENVHQSLVVHNGTILSVGDRNITAHSLTDGEDQWSFEVDNPLGGLTVDGGILYAVSSNQTEGSVHALDTDDGERFWSRSTEEAVRARPAVGEETVLVGGGSEDGFVQAHRRSGGEKLWETNTSGVVRSVSLADGRVLATEQANDSRVDLSVLSVGSGEKAWSAEGVSVHVSVSNGIVYVGGSDVHGLGLETGKMVRFFLGVRSAEAVSVGSGLVFAATDTELHALNGGEEVHYSTENETYGAGVGAILGALGITVVLRRRAV